MTTLQQQEKLSEDNDLIEGEEVGAINYAIYNKVYDAVERFSGTHFGQFVTQKLDRILQLIEDTAKWSLPHSHNKTESGAPLNRPLPWIPFIVMILVLRMIRLSLSVGCLLIGNAPLIPGDVVYFIQTRRRKLRAIRIVGKRIIHEKEQATKRNTNNGLISKLRSLLRVIICQSRQTTYSSQGSLINKNHLDEMNSTEDKQKSSARHWRKENDSDEELTLNELITKYGEASNDSDSDFIPPNDTLIHNLSIESLSRSSSDDEDIIEQLKNNTNSESVTNGSKDSTNNHNNDTNVTATENGENHLKESVKPVPMPKPQRKEIVPIPIKEIKQEPADDEETNSNTPAKQLEQIELTSSTDQQQHFDQQPVVARGNEYKQITDNNYDALTNDRELNGGEDKQYTNSMPEIFLTPATSTEDLFFSPVGSPTLSEGSETQSISNWKASNLDTVQDASVKKDQNITQPTANSMDHQQIKQNSRYYGKYNKNKYRGKPR